MRVTSQLGADRVHGVCAENASGDGQGRLGWAGQVIDTDVGLISPTPRGSWLPPPLAQSSGRQDSNLRPLVPQTSTYF
jgi:hypothetical protein